MRHLETDDVIKLYYEKVKDEYPGINAAEFMNICKMPFRFIVNQMQRPDMPIIMVKYFGKFKVTSSKMVNLLRKLEGRYQYGRIGDEEYNQTRAFYTQKIEQLLKEENGEEEYDEEDQEQKRLIILSLSNGRVQEQSKEDMEEGKTTN